MTWVVGVRSFALEVAAWAEESGLVIEGFLAPEGEPPGEVHGRPARALAAARGERVLLGTGDVDRAEILARIAAAGLRLERLIHSRAHVASSAEVMDGVIAGPGVVVGAASVLGRAAVLGRGALVGHHTVLGPRVTLGPGANVAGNVRVGEGAHVAMGALVRDHVTLGAGAVVAMGAVVVGDVPAGAVVRGVPAR